MSAADLAARMGVAETAVLSLERNERAGKAQLDTLRRAADALECDLVFALVPRAPLEEMVDRRARALAAEQLRQVDHSMRLEAQGVAPDVAGEQLLTQAALLRDRPGLWRDA
jgi:predicted DNA-binding mobile mystery protein A